MDIISILGFAAGTLTTIAFIPQVIKVYQTKETRDISLMMYVMLAAGLMLWLIYGFLLKSWPIILSNIIALIANIYLIYLKLKYG